MTTTDQSAVHPADAGWMPILGSHEIIGWHRLLFDGSRLIVMAPNAVHKREQWEWRHHVPGADQRAEGKTDDRDAALAAALAAAGDVQVTTEPHLLANLIRERDEREPEGPVFEALAAVVGQETAIGLWDKAQEDWDHHEEVLNARDTLAQQLTHASQVLDQANSTLTELMNGHAYDVELDGIHGMDLREEIQKAQRGSRIALKLVHAIDAEE